MCLLGTSAEEAESKQEIMFYVYCLESLTNGRWYIGYTKDLKRRLKEHISKSGGSFTKSNGPWKLIFYEAHINKKDARDMELFYKSGYGREVLQGKLKNYIGE
jgi:putative endonuclease